MKSKNPLLRGTGGVLTTLLLASNSAFAVDPPPVVTVPTAPEVTSRTYTSLRVTDIAPQFALRDAQGKLWHSRQILGQKAMLLLLDGDYPIFMPWLVNAEVAQTARQLFDSGTQVVVASTHLIPGTKLDEQGKILYLHDDKGQLQKLFGPSAMVMIDRSGIIRRIESGLQVTSAPAGSSPAANGGAAGATSGGTAASGATTGGATAFAFGLREINSMQQTLEEGKPAPDFAIPDMYGQVRHLADLRGQKNLLLTFFPKCFTGG